MVGIRSVSFWDSAYFQGRFGVSFREGNIWNFFPSIMAKQIQGIGAVVYQIYLDRFAPCADFDAKKSLYPEVWHLGSGIFGAKVVISTSKFTHLSANG